tara:strand:- start:110 stop:403 length:294 start_codon:yes stop_codon:yes gene_type:complete
MTEVLTTVNLVNNGRMVTPTASLNRYGTSHMGREVVYVFKSTTQTQTNIQLKFSFFNWKIVHPCIDSKMYRINRSTRLKKRKITTGVLKFVIFQLAI